MGWLTEDQLHRCVMPEFDPEDPHSVGDYWQCDHIRCNQLWYVAAAHVKYDMGADTNVIESGSYWWSRVVNPPR